jgi:hypothetical protein
LRIFLEKQIRGKCLAITAKKRSVFFGHATAANPEKVQPVIENLEIRFGRDLLFHLIEAVQIRIDDFFALDADDVRMGIRPVSIVSVAPVREPQFQNLAKRLDQQDVSVDGGETHCRKFFGDPGVDIFHGGMAFAFGQDFSDRHPLGRYFVAVILQFADDGLISVAGLRHGRSFC